MDKLLLERLAKEYETGVSANKISIRENINISTLINHLRKLGIKIRNASQGVDLYYNSEGRDKAKISEELNEIIWGNLIGDGCIRKGKSDIRGQYSHVDKNKEYIIWLKDKFEKDGIEVYYNQTIQKSKCWYLQTSTYNVFSEYRNIFYVDGKRIVPENIKLTPIVFRQWYISDGGVRSGAAISKSIYNENLMKQMKNIVGDACTYHFDNIRNYGKYYIPSKCLKDFYNYIGKSPVKCYEYKWK